MNRLPRLNAVSRMALEGRNGQFLKDLKIHLKVLRDLIEIVFRLVGGRRTVEGRLVANAPLE